jgi:hypothetical protein
MVTRDPRTPDGWRILADTMTLFYDEELRRLRAHLTWLDRQTAALDPESRPGILAAQAQTQGRLLARHCEASLAVWIVEAERGSRRA